MSPEERDTCVAKFTADYFSAAASGQAMPRLQELIELHPHPECIAILRDFPSLLPDLDSGLKEARIQQLEHERASRELREHLQDPDRYEVQEELGRGSMGIVYRATDKRLGRKVALKKIRTARDEAASGASEATQPANINTLGRFLREAEVTGSLSHPGIVPVYDVGLESGLPFYTMKLVEGKTLRSLFVAYHASRSGKVPSTFAGRAYDLPQLLDVFISIGDALAFAHSRGVIHRDIKPDNVMVGGFGEVYIMDWGLARRSTDAPNANNHGTTKLLNPIVSAYGDALGTLAYMPPEQARGLQDKIGPHSDVFAVGAMLYEMLTGSFPFFSPGENVDYKTLRSRICSSAPCPIGPSHKIDEDLKRICEKAIHGSIEGRFRDMKQFVGQLRAFREGRVVSVGRTGPWQELRKWISRNRLAALTSAIAMTALVCGLLGVSWYALEADRALVNYSNLSVVRLLQEADISQEQLWPNSSNQFKTLDRWLAGLQEWIDRDYAEVQHHMLRVETAIMHLESMMLPTLGAGNQDPSTSSGDEAAFKELRILLSWVRRRALLGKNGSLQRPAELPQKLAGKPEAFDYHVFAFEKLHEQPATTESEALALWAAERAVAQSPTSPVFLETLAIAALYNAEFDIARTSAEKALHIAETTGSADPTELAKLVDWIKWQTPLRRAALQAFREGEQRSASEFLYGALLDARIGFHSLERRALSSVQRRIVWAQQAREASLRHPKADVSWARARAGIAASDQYQNIAIDDDAIIGLVPIGMNPKTKLWEFYDLRSAWDGKMDLADIPIPKHETDGSIRVGDQTGIVFVLLPGGDVRLGAQKRDRHKPNYCARSLPDESVFELNLKPFFLARHEITRAQWRRLTGTHDSAWLEGQKAGGDPPIGPSHPADQLSWNDCRKWLVRHGMTLPTEAQWEYGARAGTETDYWPGSELENLKGKANVHDRTGLDANTEEWGIPAEFQDGYRYTAPVGTFEANKFGLHDVHGNLWEWCMDDYSSSPTRQDGNGLAMPRNTSSGDPDKVRRGGAFSSTGIHLRSSARGMAQPSSVLFTVGCRPARLLR